ncbi:peptidase inhibitor family I36 protein [Streptomyces sp. NPDC086777]|uniref:peptidase inhibitor family I36 protein n=1 Tax=Streptomyces sp. NPDC086777 TaxID=3154866 RepID=UPI003450C382
MKSTKRMSAVAAGVVLLLGAAVGTAAADPSGTSVAPGHAVASGTSVIAGSASSALSAQVATPAAVPSGCSAGYLCFWVNSGYQDGPGKLDGSNANWTVFAHPTCQTKTWNDCASSLYNDGVNDNAVVYTDANYSGSSGVIDRGVGGDVSAAWNDVISSNSWVAP